MKNDVHKLGNILGLWAHPDDETFSSGGLMAIAHANGQRVGCITATHGEKGVYHPERWSENEIEKVRTNELVSAQKILGISENYWLDFADGKCSKVTDEDALGQILPLVEKFKPDTIISFASDGITGHNDHKAVSRWTKLVADHSSYQIRILCSVISSNSYRDYLQTLDNELNIFFKIDKPRLYDRDMCDVALNLSPEVCEQKCQALQAMPSQTSDMMNKFSTDFICRAFADEYFVFAENERED